MSKKPTKKVAKKAEAAKTESKTKKVGALYPAAQVLATRKEPLNCEAMIEAKH
jgi:hypothetical protein